MTTTMGEKLREKAQQLRQEADALDIAARVMDGQQLAMKQQSVVRELAKATVLRAEQKNGSNGTHDNTAPEPKPEPERIYNEQGMPMRGTLDWEGRAKVIYGALGQRPHSTTELRQLLAANGVEVTGSRVSQIVHDLPDVKRIGKGAKSRWAMRKGHSQESTQ